MGNKNKFVEQSTPPQAPLPPVLTAAPAPMPPESKVTMPQIVGGPPGSVRPGWSGPMPPQPTRQPQQVTQPPRGAQPHLPAPASAFQQPPMMPPTQISPAPLDNLPQVTVVSKFHL